MARYSKSRRGRAPSRPLVTFSNSNGANPAAGVIADAAGNLYGTTTNGVNYGTVFQVVAGTHASRFWRRSLSTAMGLTPRRAWLPTPLVTCTGTTYYGGAYDDGTVFEVSAGTHTLSKLATFNGSNGAFPGASADCPMRPATYMERQGRAGRTIGERYSRLQPETHAIPLWCRSIITTGSSATAT